MAQPKLKIEVVGWDGKLKEEWHGVQFYELGNFFTKHQIIPRLGETIWVDNEPAYPLEGTSTDDVDHRITYATVARVMYSSDFGVHIWVKCDDNGDGNL